MASNEHKVKENYQNAIEDQRATQSRTAGLEFYYTKQHIAPYISSDKRVIELGCATGYYAMEYANRCQHYVGVDIVPDNIALFQEKIKSRGLHKVTAQVGDATNLQEIANDSFDVVLCLGPMYHLPLQERELVFAECHRICKTGGIAAFAYINQVGVYAGGCVHDQFRQFYPNEQANVYILDRCTDDSKPDLFFYTMPEAMEADAKRHGFTKLRNLGTDFFITMSVVDAMSAEQFQIMRPLLDQMATHESCTGMSNHALLICKKQ